MSLLPADTYIVINKTILDNENRNILFKLYQPVIGSVAVNLYFTLWSDLDTLAIISGEVNHHSLMTKLRLKLDDILEAREKLEAIGLMSTYLKKDNSNCYIYELYSPLDPEEFFNNPILAVALENNVGKEEYKKLIKFFTIPQIDLRGYENISANFDDTFDVFTGSSFDGVDSIRKVNKLEFVTSEKIDLNDVLEYIPNEILNKNTITDDVRKFIYKLAFIYDFNEEEMAELIRNSIDEKHFIDKAKLRKNCNNYYSFEHKGNLPSLIYKKQPEYLRKQTTDSSKKSQLIYTFETTSPFDFLSGKNKGVTPSKSDLAILETLVLDYELNPGVINVLIDYVLKINNNKLTKNFILKIADQWKRSNIITVEDAMNICKKENQQKKTVKQKANKKEIKPEWYGVNFEEEKASMEEIEKLEELLRR